MRAFIIRPFGEKQGINFDRVEAELIDPALTALEIAGRTTGEILRAGNIRTDMFQELLVSDLVIADISTNNANAFYELGIRHALRDCHTFLLRSRSREPERPPEDKAPRKNEEDVPFDLRTDRYLAYDPANPAGILDVLIASLRSTIAEPRRDSPVFLALPGLEAQEQSHFTPVPPGFAEELEIAAGKGQRQRIALLGLEARGFTWETAGLRAVGRKQFFFKYFADARSTWESVLEIHPDDVEANTLLGTIYQRLNEPEKSNVALRRVVSRPNLRRADLAEAHALLGRNLKQLWQEEWKQASPDNRRTVALESPLLLEAYEQYRKGWFQDLNAHYPAINALGLLSVYLDLAGDDADEALRAQAAPLTECVGLAIEATKAQKGDSDIWLNITAADLRLFTPTKPSDAVAAYRTALRGAPPFAKESAARQLEFYRDLGVLKEKVAAVLAAIAPPAPAQERVSTGPGHVILFTGHRIDSPGRAKPRFPAACEEKARKEIETTLQKILKSAKGSVIGVAGAACGGDILFHEECGKLGIATRVCLAMPRDQYIQASVLPDWVARFDSVVGAGLTDVLSENGKLPPWLTDKPSYGIWQRNNLWELSTALAFDAPLTLIALWDGQTGDGPGGTEHMVGLARKRGAAIQVLDMQRICA